MGPTTQFTFNPFTGCRPLPVTFNDQTLPDGVHNIVKWVWDYGDGITQNIYNTPFTHIYDTAGYFNARLTVTDSHGCTNTLLNGTQVFVTDPKAVFTSVDTLVCIGSNVRFTNSSTELI